MVTSNGIDVPAGLAAYHDQHSGLAGRNWIAGLPGLAAAMLSHWRLRVDGASMHGMLALVIPVRRHDDTPAALKLQPVDEETTGEATALRIWDGAGVVRLLDSEPDTGSLLLERLDSARPLSTMADDDAAIDISSGLLARLTSVTAPAGLRTLADIAAKMLEDVPEAVGKLGEHAERQLVHRCAGAVAEVLPEPGNQLLHWDLHYDNILAGQREPWLAIDPKPLAGDPGFDLEPAIHNSWDKVTGSGDVDRAVLRRFDRLTDALGLDRARAASWTLGRVLQNTLWDIEDGEHEINDIQATIARVLLTHRI